MRGIGAMFTCIPTCIPTCMLTVIFTRARVTRGLGGRGNDRAFNETEPVDARSTARRAPPRAVTCLTRSTTTQWAVRNRQFSRRRWHSQPWQFFLRLARRTYHLSGRGCRCTSRPSFAHVLRRTLRRPRGRLPVASDPPPRMTLAELQRPRDRYALLPRVLEPSRPVTAPFECLPCLE